MKRYIRLFIALLTVAALTTSCNQKELCEDHWEHAPRYNYKVRATYDPQWQLTYEGGTDWRANWDLARFELPYDSLLPAEPEGLRTLVYNTERYYDTYNTAPHGGQIGISQGQHSLLFYNNDTEYIIFNGLSSAFEASATTRTRTRSTYLGSPMMHEGKPEHTVNPPDMLYARYIPEFEGTMTTDTTYIDVELRPLVFRYLVRYHFDYGIQYVRIARGALAGMAGSVFLTDGRTPEDPATVLFDIDVDVEQLKAKYRAQLEARAAAQAAAASESKSESKSPSTSKSTSESTSKSAPPATAVGTGMLYTIVNSFGAPGFPNPNYTRANQSYGLNLEVRLGNGKILNYDFDITDQIARQPRGGIIDVYGVVITDEDGKDSSGAFDVNVDGWGDVVDIPIFSGNANNSK